MKRSLFALSASLLIILGSLIVLHWSREKPKDLGWETPKGVPPSQKILVEKPQVEAAQEAMESVVVPESVQTEPQEWIIVDVRARITHDGQPLSGALMVAQQITIRPDDGTRDTLSLFDFPSMGHDRRSDQDGNIGLKVRYPVDTAGDSLFGVAVFHSERGTAYDEISIDDLTAGRVLELEPELGEILVGRVIDTNGEPIPDAQVSISTSWPNDAVCLSGLGALSGPDGSFIIPGFRFENTLHTVSAIAHSEQFLAEERTLITERGSARRIVDRETDFNEQENTWTIGDISLALTKRAVDLITGEATELPSDE